MLKVTILDGYVDEPTCLGVPPYISPYPRYIAGAIWDYDKSVKISYVTIDQIRNNKKLEDLSKSDLVITIAGMAVPGRYLSGFPASPNELVTIMNNLPNSLKILCGPVARYGFGMSGGKKIREIDFVKDSFDLIAKGDGEILVSKLLDNKIDLEKIDSSECRENAHTIRGFAVKGADIVKQHPFFPDYLITEIETYRGCPRSIVGGCSFCSEPSRGPPDFRPIEDVIDEIKSLYKNGVRHFRIGNQPCIFSYMAKDAGKTEFPRPNPDALEKLFKGICTVAPDLKTLHIDNANPGVIARYPNECKRIAKNIVKYHTPGDVAAFGVESVDPVVIKKNNLKASADEVLSAIKLLNEVGSKRGINGMPHLLPGLNFVFGLEGETKNTYELNYEFLKKILEQDLLLRRINLRQIIPIPGTKMYQIGSKIISKNKNLFKKFKKKIREEIERPMLKKLLPIKTVLKDVYSEKYKGKLTFGRQLGSYPLLVGIPGIQPMNKFLDVKIVDYGYRSITGIPYPLDINIASREILESIPGVGKKRAIRILANRPFKNKEELIKALDEENLMDIIQNYVSI
jgi:radical SAM superfamily enzyme with C-terminal helix-hairpin-helix motif